MELRAWQDSAPAVDDEDAMRDPSAVLMKRTLPGRRGEGG